MTWQSTLSWKNAQKRADILQQIRSFFAERNVLEVETPALAQSTITDVHLDAFSCQYNFLQASEAGQSVDLYLQTSPEFHMKRLLASGYGCIYQIAKAFRHEGYGRFHNPEFTMLEWYRLGFDHFQLMDEVAVLLRIILKCQQPTQITYQDLFKRSVALDPLTASTEEVLTVIKQHNKVSDWLLKENDIDILLQFTFSEIIEPTIGLTEPCFVYNFPRSQAALAKISVCDHRVAERFECYFQGVELVNGFHELTDAQQQLERFQEDNCKRLQMNLPKRSIDKNFIQALQKGLPACSGVALGIDRLVMLALKITHIEQVQTFPIERA